jgi:hypothetical protein
MEESLIIAEGHSGIVEVQGGQIRIRRPGLMAGISGQDDAHLPLGAVSEVEFKDAGPHVNGWVRFRGHDEEPYTLARSQLWNHPRVVFFTYEQRDDFVRLTTMLQNLLVHNGVH